ncbi:uncharacterized protein F5891DRAFT_1131963 [Suillus fuscotomentosus]|uniref:C2H2-type domain-containing protein n=1 Tax=Suillus fuscotomentosus TaxID=1912939 RepID=A0AAD4DPT4_9AGAM|nr:uncharacterized protein F5891DRAFT_1131963 [Suillus fuscotomentosus]KAG1888937.1 hypothetical protein F5891DRAFT_1131963 [Suillus fuscotomentosus]
MPDNIPRSQLRRHDHSSLQLPCRSCPRWFKTIAGRTKHRISAHPIPPVLPQDNHKRSPEPIIPESRLPSPQPHVDHNIDMDVDEGYADLEHQHQPSPQPNIDMEFVEPGDHLYQNYHTGLNARPCNMDGIFLLPGTQPPPLENVATGDWTPFCNRTEFEMAEFLYTQNQMPAGQINRLLDLWASTLAKHGDKPPFADHRDLYNIIDNSPFGDVNWQNFTVTYDGERPEDGTKPWMDDKYEVWFRDPHEVVRNMLANPTYASEVDYCPYREYSTEGDKRQWKDFMSGDWAWDQADEIAKDPSMLGSTFVPVILGSDKMTVSVGTGNNEYYPLYASIGNIRNNVQRAHRDGVAVIGFLAMPKTTKEHATEAVFRKFRRQLFHSSLSKILNTLKPGMTTPEVTRFGDGHYRRVIYGLGPYIADYEEQALLACIVRGWCPKCMASREDLDEDVLRRCREYTEALVQEGSLGDLWDDFGIVGELVAFTNDFPRADIHQMISPDILHQLVKGAFKDHLVEWVEKYLRHTHTKRKADQIMDDIDCRIAAVASFSGLRRFPQGRGFKQWTGDDSKALMKVYLPAIEGHVPVDVVRTFRALLEFCYLVRRNIITEDTLVEIEDALSRFHHYRNIFRTTGVVPTFSLPPRADFTRRGMLTGTCLSVTMDALAPAPAPLLIGIDEDLEIDDGPTVLQAYVQLAKTRQGKKRAQTIPALAEELNIPSLPDLLRRFLFQQLHPKDPRDPSNIPLAECPLYLSKISVFNSASSRFYAPSDLSGIGGMRVEHIRSCPIWRNEYQRHDCVFINTDSSLPGMQGLEVARVRAFFSFRYQGRLYPCTLISWFDKVGDAPDEDTGMWIVRPGFGADSAPGYAVIHIDSIYRAAHLIPMYGVQFVPWELKFYHSYDAFQAYYVNKYTDHHAFEIAF